MEGNKPTKPSGSSQFNIFPKTIQSQISAKGEIMKRLRIDREARYAARAARRQEPKPDKGEPEESQQEDYQVENEEGEEEIPRRRKQPIPSLRLTAPEEYELGVVDPVALVYGLRGKSMCDLQYRKELEHRLTSTFTLVDQKELIWRSQISQYANQINEDEMDDLDLGSLVIGIGGKLNCFIPHYTNLMFGVNNKRTIRVINTLFEHNDHKHFKSLTQRNSGVYLFCPKVRWISGGNAMRLDKNPRFEDFDPESSIKDAFQLYEAQSKQEMFLDDVVGLKLTEKDETIVYETHDWELQLATGSDEYNQVVSILLRAERTDDSENVVVDREEMQLITQFFSREGQTTRTRVRQIEIGTMLGRTTARIMSESGGLMRSLFSDFIFNLRINSADELLHFRSAFDAAGRANKLQLNTFNLNNLPSNMQMEEVEGQSEAFTAELRINYPFQFVDSTDDEKKVLKAFTTAFIWYLCHYTQYPQIKGVGVLSPVQIFFLWTVFSEILTITVTRIIEKSKTEIQLRSLAVYIFRMLKPYHHSAACMFIKGQQPYFILTPGEPVGEPTRDRTTFELTIMTAFQEFLKEYGEIFKEQREVVPPTNRNIDNFDKIVTIEQTPVNINNFNTSFTYAGPRPSLRLVFPTNTQFKRIFNEQLEQEMKKINLVEYRKQFEQQQQFNRLIDFEIIDISSETTGQLAMEILRSKVADKVSDIYFTLNPFPIDYIDQTIEGWKIFIGLEIITIRRDELEHIVEIEAEDDINRWLNNSDQRVVRMAHCTVQLSNIGRTKGGDYNYFFGNARAYFRNKAREVPMRGGLRSEKPAPNVDVRGREPPRDRDDIGIKDALADVMEFLQDLDADDQLGAFDDTSGPVDQDAQFEFVDSAQFISKITLFTMPTYRNMGQVVPLRASVRHAPVIFNSLDYNLLQENDIHSQIVIDVMENDLERFDNPLNNFSYFTCIQMSLYFILNKLNMKKILAYSIAKQFEGTIQDMLNLIMEQSEEPYRSSIAIFFTEGCILTFHHESQFTPVISDFMRDEKYNQHPILCIRNQTSQQGMAHIFPTVLQNVKEFIKAIGNFSMRQLQNDPKRRAHPGFVLKAAYKPFQLPKPLNQDVYRNKIMDQVWALDIETVSAPGKAMEPYCIVVWTGKFIEFQIIAHPVDTIPAFQKWLTLLKVRRSAIPEQQLKDLHIYAHNGSRFDWVILIRSILRVFPDALMYGIVSNIKAIVIKSIQVKFLDFILMVPGSLDKIGKAFNVNRQQTECEEVKYSDKFSSFTAQQKEKILQYCINDTQCLWQCIQSFVKEVIEIMDPINELPIKNILPITNSSLAQEVFKYKFQQAGDFMGTTSLEIDQIESDAYFGGMTQAFNYHELKNVYYIDVNSLYPYAMTEINISNEPAEPSNVVEFIWSLGDKRTIYNNCLYKVVEFIFWQHSPGLLPVRCPDGTLCYPQMSLGKACWRTGWEINALISSQLLQSLVITHALNYPGVNTGSKPFKRYVETVYEMKKHAKDEVQKTLYKLLLNQLYGKFAQRSYPTIRIISSMDVYNDPSLPSKLAREQLNAAILCDLMDQNTDQETLEKLWNCEKDPISKQKQITFVPVIAGVNQVDKENEFIQVTMEKSILDIQRVGMLKRISVMTTGCARAHMIKAFSFLHMKFKQQMLKHVHYMDTDSLFVSAEGQETLARMMDEKELGKFQLEIPCKINRMQIFGNKVYFAEPEQGPTLYKFKGISSKYIQETLKDDFERRQLFYDIFAEKLPPQTKTQLWKRQFGAVIISEATKVNISKPRREVNSDGTSSSYLTVDDYLDSTSKYRLIRRGNEYFGYQFHYHPIEKDVKQQK